MEPRIRYVQSADGTRIATCSLGQGPPLVIINNFYLTIEIIWEIPEALTNIERLSQKRTVVLYDARGAGLSRQRVEDFSAEAGVADLAAVVDSLDLAPVDVLCPGTSTTIGVIYAAQHPDKLRRLVLQSPFMRGSVMFADERRNLLLPLATVDWPLYLQCLALVNYGWTDVGRRIAEKQGKEASRAVWARSSQEWANHDVSALVPLVRCPTLVLDARSGPITRDGWKQSAEVAAAMPNARLARYDRDHSLMLAASWDSCLRIVEDFLDEGSSPSAHPEPVGGPSGTAVIFFADIVDSTALTERLGDTAFRDKARDLDSALRTIIRESAGTPIEGKLLGDGVLAVFTSARQAIEAALACGTAGEDGGLPLHLGIHAGDVIREDNNVYGGAVNIAARISGLSAPGEVLVSDTVRSLARTSAGVSFEDRGEHELKGIAEPVRVFAVRQA